MNATCSEIDPASADESPFRCTPSLILGPFYPPHPPVHAGSTLWAPAPGHSRRLQLVEIGGRVINAAGMAVCDALVEIWQADECGRYGHPGAPQPAPADPTFARYGALRTDACGLYRFHTLKPGAYGDGAKRRAPHVHFQVTGLQDRLVTQMFFPDEPLNAGDHWYRSVKRPQDLVARVQFPHFMAMLLARETRVALTHVPYRGGLAAMQDAAAGQVSAALATEAAALALEKAGKLRVLATTGSDRSAFLPQAPTLREMGYPNLTQREWFAAFMPARTPAAVVASAADGVQAALRDPGIRDVWHKAALSAEGSTPAELSAALRKEHDFWGPVIKASGFTPEA
jgi:Tripartite tricarboxylate transporter family receptor/Dioxygenase